MNFNDLSNAPCVVPPSTVAGKCAGIDPRCLDLEWAANHPETCPGAASIVSLHVVPDIGEVDVGGAVPFAAQLVFSNGLTKDVTDGSTWTTTDTSIATVDPTGLAAGLAVGSTNVQARYKGLVDIAQLDVIAHCVQAGLDIVLVFDRSAGMADKMTTDGNPTPGGLTILELAKRAATALVSSAYLTDGKDQIAVVSCAGIYREGQVTPYTPDSTLHMRLSHVPSAILAATDNVHTGNCYYDTAPGQHNTECATGIGAGLARAHQELIDHGRANTRKLVVYIGLGYEVFCQPDPPVVAAELVAANIEIAGIVTGPPFFYHPCSILPSGGTTWDYVRALVTCNLFFGVEDLNDLANAFSACLSSLCAIQNAGCVYYVAPVVGPPAPVRYRDQLDYNGFINWNVTRGFVDLIGIDLWPLQPGHGMYVDMVGTDLLHPRPAEKNTLGTIETKRTFTLGPGRYRFSLKVSGNLIYAGPPMGIKITIGTLLVQTVMVANWQQPLTEYIFDFSSPGSTSAPIIIKALQPEPISAWVRTVGPLIDDVKLENLDTSIVLFFDDFDQENPLPA
jgi:hypothetical protein